MRRESWIILVDSVWLLSVAKRMGERKWPAEGDHTVTKNLSDKTSLRGQSRQEGSPSSDAAEGTGPGHSWFKFLGTPPPSPF